MYLCNMRQNVLKKITFLLIKQKNATTFCHVPYTIIMSKIKVCKKFEKNPEYQEKSLTKWEYTEPLWVKIFILFFTCFFLLFCFYLLFTFVIFFLNKLIYYILLCSSYCVIYYTYNVVERWLWIESLNFWNIFLNCTFTC